MIPISLTLRNFMSYGEEGQTLSFDGIHVACLTGDNGNGKSALLDAITWSLWGKTRASAVQSVTEDDLIRRSADEMEVRFEFELNDQKYRVVRKRRRGKPGDWQLAQSMPEGDYAAIGGGGTRTGVARWARASGCVGVDRAASAIPGSTARPQAHRLEISHRTRNTR